MRKIIPVLLITTFALFTMAQQINIRTQKDTVGFASNARQMDSVMNRIEKRFAKYYDSIYEKQNIEKNDVFRFAICPHDDYTYAGFLYNEVQSHIKAKTIIIIGVAHKAKKYGIEQKIVFDSFDKWQAPYGNATVSRLRQKIIDNLPADDFIIHDSLQAEEHSVEAFVPFLQYYNKDVEIISILVPHMPYSTMENISSDLSLAIVKVLKENSLQWGKDVALLVSTDAVHYGDKDWGGKTYASFGCDNAGYAKAVEYEKKIINECLTTPDVESAKKFTDYTVQRSDWHEYKWTWCGRYSVPFGLLCAFQLQQLFGSMPLKLALSDYSTSIAQQPLKVDDLKMGATATANLHHWVGYAAAGYR